MPYTITLSDGITSLITIPDRSILGPLEVDTSSNCSLNLVGRGASNFGTAYATNFVWLLQNFANATAPVSPTPGQIWYNNTAGDSTLRLYNSSGQWVQIATSDAPFSSMDDIIAYDGLGDSSTLGANGTITLIRTNYQPYVKFEGIANSSNAITLQLSTDKFGNPDLSIASPYFANVGQIWHSVNLTPFDIAGDNIITGNNVFTGYNVFTEPTNFSEIIVHNTANTAIVDIKPDSIQLKDNSANSATITFADPFTTMQLANSGNFNVIGNAIMLNGNVVVTTGQLSSLPYLPIAGGTMTGSIVSPSIPIYLNTGKTVSVNFNSTTNAIVLSLVGSPSANLNFYANGTLSGVTNISATGNIAAGGQISAPYIVAATGLIGTEVLLRSNAAILAFQNPTGSVNNAYLTTPASVPGLLQLVVGTEVFDFYNTGKLSVPGAFFAANATTTGDMLSGTRHRSTLGAYGSGDVNACTILYDHYISFPSSNNGYYRAPNGFIDQVFTAMVPCGGGYVTTDVTIPTAFPNGMLDAMICFVGTTPPNFENPGSLAVSPLSGTQVRVTTAYSPVANLGVIIRCRGY